MQSYKKRCQELNIILKFSLESIKKINQIIKKLKKYSFYSNLNVNKYIGKKIKNIISY